MFRLPVILRDADAGTGDAGAPAPAPVVPNPSPAADPPKPAAAALEAEVRARLLAEIGGGKSPDQIKAALELADRAAEAAKSDAEKAAAAKAEAEAAKARASVLEEAIKGHAEAELQKLTPEQRAAVVALSGTDPAKVIPTIHHLRPTWVSQAVDKAPVAPVGNTAPAPGTAPAPAQPNPAVDHKAKLEALSKNPYAAAQYAARHFRELHPDA